MLKILFSFLILILFGKSALIAADNVVTVSGTKYNVTYKYTNYDSDESFFTSGNLTWGNKSLAQSINADVGYGGKSYPGVLIPYAIVDSFISIYYSPFLTDCPFGCPFITSNYWYAYTELGRTAFNTRITKSSRSKILTILEQINTNGTNASLISALDNLSDTALEKASIQNEGATIKSINGQSFKNHSTFKRAVSSALATPSVSSLTRNNYASLSLNDLNFNQSQNEYQMYSANSFDFKSMANIFKNKDLFSLKSKGSTLFFRTFGDQTNQDKIGTDKGFESSTAWFLLGNQNNLTDDIEQGWSFGYSTNDTDFDENYGNSEANTLHAMIYQNQQYDNFVLGLNLGTYVSRTDMDREITDGSVQTLKSRSYNHGFDITADIKQSYHLENNFTFTPSFSTNLSYIIQDDLDESGGDLALSVKNDNLLIVKPEIGFALEKNFNQTDQVSKSLGFSVYGSYEEKLDGTTSKAKIKDTGSNFDIVDENKNDTFVTTGLGYTFLDKIGNTEYNFGVFYTQNDNNNLNSTLASFNYNKKF